MSKDIHRRFFITFLALTGLLLSACNTSKYLKSGENLLKETKIIFKNGKNIPDKNSLEKELEKFIVKKPNGKILGIPKEYIYMVNSQPHKNKWYHKSLKSLGEPPVIYSEEDTKTIASNMENFLRFKKGFYHARVDFLEEDLIRGWSDSRSNSVWFNSAVKFIISTGDRYKINEITYASADAELLKFVHQLPQQVYVKKGDYIDFSSFEAEKSRLTIELQNHGYANFSNSYIEISGDSSQVNKSIDIVFQIRTPQSDSAHQQFETGDIRVFTDFFKDQKTHHLRSDSLLGIQLFRQTNEYLIKPNLIYNSIFFKEGKLLSRDDRQKTFRKLNNLGTYRFVSINASIDSLDQSKMNFDIQLSPYQKKWVYDGGLQFYYSTLTSSRLLGTSISSQFVNRNLLGGSERYSLRAESGIEFGFDDGKAFIRTINASIQNNLNIPSFQDFLGLGRLISRIGLIKDKYYQNVKEEARTNIDLGYSSVNILNFYSINSFNTSFGFDYSSPKNNRYIFKPLGFNLDLYDIKDTARFEKNQQLLLSFSDIVGTGFLFRELSYIFNSQKSKNGHSFTLINNLELSGWEIHLSNLLYNTIAGNQDEWTVNRTLKFAKYIRYEFDGRYSKEFTPGRSFASRFNFGIVVPFGQNKSVPFIRQFGVGGPNSLRAWNIKEAGPGGYRDPLTKLKEITPIFVNQGDIRLELNLEYRFKILLVLDGAVFVDAGNVWALRDDENRPGASFSSKFYEQIAVGVGYGLRLNFNFFIIRFDFGYKVRNPFLDPYKKSQWLTFKEIRDQGLGTLQVAVSYPF